MEFFNNRFVRIVEVFSGLTIEIYAIYRCINFVEMTYFKGELASFGGFDVMVLTLIAFNVGYKLVIKSE